MIKSCDIDPASLRCRVCGSVATSPTVRRNCRPGLGDMVAATLDSVGITKERIRLIVRGPCGCQERQAALNAAGAKWLGMSPGSTSAENSGVDARTGAARLGE